MTTTEYQTMLGRFKAEIESLKLHIRNLERELEKSHRNLRDYEKQLEQLEHIKEVCQ